MYTVIELQTTDKTTGVLTWTFESINEAYSKYFSVLSFAATSPVEIHSVVMLNEKGMCLMNYSFDKRT